MNILIVDDVEDDVRIMADIVRRLLNYEFAVARHGKEAIRLATELKPDLILLDLLLPELDGLEVAEQIKDTEELRGTPIIAVTNYDSEIVDLRQRALVAGCDDYFMKPLDIEALVEAINTHLAV